MSAGRFSFVFHHHTFGMKCKTACVLSTCMSICKVLSWSCSSFTYFIAFLFSFSFLWHYSFVFVSFLRFFLRFSQIFFFLRFQLSRWCCCWFLRFVRSQFLETKFAADWRLDCSKDKRVTILFLLSFLSAYFTHTHIPPKHITKIVCATLLFVVWIYCVRFLANNGKILFCVFVCLKLQLVVVFCKITWNQCRQQYTFNVCFLENILN